MLKRKANLKDKHLNLAQVELDVRSQLGAVEDEMKGKKVVIKKTKKNK